MMLFCFIRLSSFETKGVSSLCVRLLAQLKLPVTNERFMAKHGLAVRRTRPLLSAAKTSLAETSYRPLQSYDFTPCTATTNIYN